MSRLAVPGSLTLRRAEPVMGTIVSFDVRAQGQRAVVARAALREACEVLHQADQTFSLYRADSPLSKLRRGELGIDEAPQEIADVLDHCARVRELSHGWFDPWALPGGVDPTGLVKGWAAQRALDVLADAGIGAAMVNAAGDIALFGRPAPDRRWRIGVRGPDQADQLCCIVEPCGAVATSGQYERGPHVLNPHTGTPATGAWSATVCGPELTVADGLATGLLAAGPLGLAPVLEAGYEALLVDRDGTQRSTDGFPIVG